MTVDITLDKHERKALEMFRPIGACTARTLLSSGASRELLAELAGPGRALIESERPGVYRLTNSGRVALGGAQPPVSNVTPIRR